MKITAPNKDYSGMIAGVQFINGEADTENVRLIQWARENGFTVEAEAVPFEPEPPQWPENDFDNLDDLTIRELKEIATEAGVEVPNRVKKSELIQMIREG